MKTKDITQIALFTAITCVIAPLSIPIGAIPISFTNLVLYLALHIIGTKKSLISYIAYFVIGAVGVPVFSGYSGGLAKIVGPTGGCLIGFIFMIIIGGYFIEKFSNKLIHILGMIIGTIVVYALGTIWYCITTQNNFIAGIMVCVVPFIIGDLIKIIVAEVLGVEIKKRLH